MKSQLHFKIPDSANVGVNFNAPILDAYLGERKLGSIIQTKRNLPDGAAADQFYLANSSGEAVPETDAYTLPACLAKLEACLDQSCPPKQLMDALHLTTSSR
jgi:hypothetical protein